MKTSAMRKLGAAFLPNTNGHVESHLSNEPAQRVVVERQVRVTPARRTEVNALFDAFVPSAVERHDPRVAYGLVTPAFRAGVTRKVSPPTEGGEVGRAGRCICCAIRSPSGSAAGAGAGTMCAGFSFMRSAISASSGSAAFGG